MRASLGDGGDDGEYEEQDRRRNEDVGVQARVGAQVHVVGGDHPRLEEESTRKNAVRTERSTPTLPNQTSSAVIRASSRNTPPYPSRPERADCSISCGACDMRFL